MRHPLHAMSIGIAKLSY